MTAELLAPEPGSERWLRYITASKVAAILGVSKYDSPFSVWQLMKGNVDKLDQNDEQARGHYHEAGVLAWFRDQHPELHDWKTNCWIEHEGWLGATLDAVALDPEDDPVVVEVKTIARADDWDSDETGASIDGVPIYYWTQVQLQMWLEGAKRAYVAVLGGWLEHREYLVPFDADQAQKIVDACWRFWLTLADDVAPDLDDHVATYETVRRLHPDIDGSEVEVDRDLAAAYVEASLLKASAEAEERLQKTRLLDAAGKAKDITCGGVKVARRQASSRGAVSLHRVAKDAAPFLGGKDE